MKARSENSNDSTQLPLDFELEVERVTQCGASETKANVVDICSAMAARIALRRRTEVDAQDSVLDEILSDARKLNW